LSRYIVGTDIGGTFSEAVAVDLKTREHRYSKVSSTPPTYVDGIMRALQTLGISGSEVTTFLAHGSTIGTNAIIQRTGANTGLVTTEGFRDVLLAARSDREIMYDLEWDPPPPLVQRRNILTVTERVDYEGKEITPLDASEVSRIGEVFKKRKTEAVAISFINSFVNPEHEVQAKKILAEALPDAYICASTDVLPEIREFERESTTVANVYIGPIIEKYLSDVIGRLRDWGFTGDLLVTHSGGGVMTRDVALKFPIRTCHSSPVSGAIGLGRYVGKLCGYDNVITFEMGGTSTDIAMFHQGKPIMSYEWHVSFTVPVLFPAVDAIYLGAGGGSMAWIDDAGALRVGPYSAGARPGPACYGIGGDKPTITDSQLVLKRLNPNYFLGGEIKLSSGLAEKALRHEIADHFHWDAPQAADAILRIAIASMVEGVRMVSVKRGIDARDFCLVAYGGAGPLHAPEVARELHIPLCVIPPNPGYGSAYGALRIDFSHDFVRSIHKVESEVQITELVDILGGMEREASEVMRAAEIPESKVTMQPMVDVKYFDQSRALTIDVPSPLKGLPQIWKSFLSEHKKRYGYVLPEGYAELEIVNVRLRVLGERPKPSLRLIHTTSLRKAFKEEREVHFSPKGFIKTPVYERGAIPAKTTIRGPAVIEQPDSTSIVYPGMKMMVDTHGNLLISTGA
jgi:N-methylhydantoinase A